MIISRMIRLKLILQYSSCLRRSIMRSSMSLGIDTFTRYC